MKCTNMCQVDPPAEQVMQAKRQKTGAGHLDALSEVEAALFSVMYLVFAYTPICEIYADMCDIRRYV